MAMARAALVDDLLGSLVRVARDDWTAISQRVGYTSRLRAIAGTVAEHLPEFPALLVACDAWRDTTFPAVVAASIQLGSYSKEAFEVFSGLLASTDWSVPLAPEVQDRVRRTLKDLAARTRALDAEFRGVATAVAAFYEVNRSVDTEVGAFVERLGPSWGSILPATTAVGRATGLVRGAWEALSSDLDALGGDSIDGQRRSWPVSRSNRRCWPGGTCGRRRTPSPRRRRARRSTCPASGWPGRPGDRAVGGRGGLSGGHRARAGRRPGPSDQPGSATGDLRLAVLGAQLRPWRAVGLRVGC